MLQYLGLQQRFEWDPLKAATNLRRHGVSFTEARSVFDDPFLLRVLDDTHSDRFVAIGQSNRSRLLVAVVVEKTYLIRIISARRATRDERKRYEEET